MCPVENATPRKTTMPVAKPTPLLDLDAAAAPPSESTLSNISPSLPFYTELFYLDSLLPYDNFSDVIGPTAESAAESPPAQKFLRVAAARVEAPSTPVLDDGTDAIGKDTGMQ
ncbi:unnamed protein product [Zymoseptoria tritici ST99CH_1A5]|uniref:Uncharacterized protein n=1 Tax=Zymoseptoria tritici ST99CH_1A5 TaxID=1276529 RepID=A0A1Y6M1T5_ZYMTR|nr:unnamed protein product [Zymoseptoria tritici ST99CH_1A5]